jgi:hypothetical protein
MPPVYTLHNSRIPRAMRKTVHDPVTAPATAAQNRLAKK